MGNSLRCCLACILPCGPLDVVRIVHLNGQVEEFSRQVSAGEILEANPDHIISKPCFQGVTDNRILSVTPDSDLKRGHIYFLIPASSLPENKRRRRRKKMVDEKELAKEVLSKKKPNCHRRRSGRVAVWRPHLESITEDW